MSTPLKLGFPRDGTFRDNPGQDVLLSLCPGTKKFLCPDVYLSRDKGRSKNPETNSSVPGRPGTKLLSILHSKAWKVFRKKSYFSLCLFPTHMYACCHLKGSFFPNSRKNIGKKLSRTIPRPGFWQKNSDCSVLRPIPDFDRLFQPHRSQRGHYNSANFCNISWWCLGLKVFYKTWKMLIWSIKDH